MRLSAYIQALQKIQAALTIDPEVVIQRYSDLTTEGCEPRVIEANPNGDGAWSKRYHPTMPETDRARLVTYVELAEGN